MQVCIEGWVRGGGAPEPAVGFCWFIVGATLVCGWFVARDIGGEEVDGTGWVGGCDCVAGRGEEGLGEVFYDGAGFGVEEGAGLRVAVEAEEFEGGHDFFFFFFSL